MLFIFCFSFKFLCKTTNFAFIMKLVLKGPGRSEAPSSPAQSKRPRKYKASDWSYRTFCSMPYSCIYNGYGGFIFHLKSLYIGMSWCNTLVQTNTSLGLWWGSCVSAASLICLAWFLEELKYSTRQYANLSRINQFERLMVLFMKFWNSWKMDVFYLSFAA